MTPLWEMTAADIARRVSSGELSALTVVEAHLSRIFARNPVLNAFTDVTVERAIEKAKVVDARRVSGEHLGQLAGVPFAVKNLFDIAGLPTRAGSKINRNTAPALADSPLISRLEAEDAILVGGLNMNEYAYGFTGENSHHGPSRNPLDTNRMTGGSSGGSAGAVAGRLVPLALGSDTNGSIRVPASFCGLFGLKPTYGRLTRVGTFPFVESLDHLGSLARSVIDLALSYDAMQGSDSPATARGPQPVKAICPLLDAGVSDLRVATLGGYFARGGESAVHAAVERVATALGATSVVELPEAHRARAAAFVITSVEGGQLHLDRLRNRAADFDPATRDRLLAGNLVPGAWYLQAQRFRRWFQGEVMRVFDRFDILLAPSTPCAAPFIDQQTLTFGGREVPLRPNIGIFTQPISFIGLPVVAAPLAEVADLPVGVQIIAAPWREDMVFRVARYLERSGVCTSIRVR